MIVLGIETSCDETAVGIVDNTARIRADCVYSQLDLHALHGGVVPEIAARAHVEKLPAMLAAALREASLSWRDIDGVAATCGPGLIGGVMVGMMAGKAAALAADKPFIAVNHLEAHVLTARLTDHIEFPYLVLLVSGGHTQILLASGVGSYRLLGTTRDDAAGECFDKCAKLMGLGYPGGPALEKLAATARDPQDAMARFPLPLPLANQPGCDFSFSGLKTAARLHMPALRTEADRADLAFAIQHAIARTLSDRTARALSQLTDDNINPTALVVAGGVAANGAVRTALDECAHRAGKTLIAPPVRLCTDNGVMIAWAGLEKLRCGRDNPLDTPARPRWPLSEVA